MMSDSFHIYGQELYFSERFCEYAMQLRWPYTSTFR